MVGCNLVLPGSCTGELKMHFILVFWGFLGVFFWVFSSKIFEYLSLSGFKVGTHPSGTVNIQSLPPLPERSEWIFLTFLLGGSSLMSGSSDGLIGQNSVQLPRLEEEITNPTDFKECHYETQGTEFSFCSENNRHFLGEIPHFWLGNFLESSRILALLSPNCGDRMLLRANC